MINAHLESRLYCWLRMAISFACGLWLTIDVMTAEAPPPGSDDMAAFLKSALIVLALAVSAWVWFLRETAVWRRLIAAEYPPLQKALEEEE